jgi:TRAP transporter TAXI family solute receptor
MRRSLSFALFAIGAVALFAAPASAGFNDKNPITATVTGATPTGYPRVMIEGLNAIVRDAYPGSSVSLKPNSPGGGVLAIANKEADFTATASGNEIKLANEGKMPFTAPLKGKFSYVMMLYDNQYMHFLMTKAWSDENGIKTWDDIARKKPRIRLAINRPDNPQTTIGGPYEVMKAHGFTIGDIEKWGGSYVLGNSSIGLDAIKDGKADMFTNARNLGDSLIKDIASNRPLLFIDGDRAKIEKAAKVWDFRLGMVPKGTYPFMDKDYPTVRQWVSMLAGAHVSDETAYKVVKAIAEGQDSVKKIGGSLGAFSTQLMAQKPTNLPWHPGALRYYKEKGLVK